MASRSVWNLWMWLTGDGCGWNLCVCLVGVVVRGYIDFLILLIPTPLVSVPFYCSISTFCSFLIIKIELKVRMSLPKTTDKRGVIKDYKVKTYIYHPLTTYTGPTHYP